MKHSIPLMIGLLSIFMFSNCASEIKKDDSADHTEAYNCAACHDVTGSVLPNDHPVIHEIDSESVKRIRNIIQAKYTSKLLDGSHIHAGITCKGCHGSTMPELDTNVENDICLGCHDSYDNLAELTTNDEMPEKNPHKSHLGDIACVVCHHAHSTSKCYCLECHKNYCMPMPGMRKSKK